MGDVLTRVRNIYVLMSEGHSLKGAAHIADGKAPKPVADWSGAFDRFKVQKLQHGRTLKPETWRRCYLPVLSDVVDLMNGSSRPDNTADLMDLVIRKWEPGSRMRQIRAQSLSQFLRHCVARENFPSLWLPPAHLASHVGAKGSQAGPGQKGDPLTDQQILNLLDSLTSDRAASRWADAIRLMSELGLRPIELLFLKVKTDPSTGRPIWWCDYRKRSGGGDTLPRRVHPLPLVDNDGILQQWNLLQRWEAGLIELPPLASGNGAGDSIATYLNRHLGGLDEALFCLDVNETFGAWTRFTEFPRYAAVQFKYVLLRDKILFPTHNSSLKSQIKHLKTQLLIDIEEPEFSKQDIIDQDNLGSPYRWRGIVFRTKSEQLLAIRLFKDNICFLYEPKVPLRYDTSRYRLPDFCIISKGRILRVELDGRQFHENKTGQISIDRSVDMQFQKAGMSTIRFDSHKVHNQIDVVIRDILECVANLP